MSAESRPQLPHTHRGKVYSYLRFSTPEQKFGDSIRRQTQAANDYATKEGLIFDESLQMRDEGISGYSGKNKKKGALGHFLSLVESGKIEPGSVLFVEDLDRLSRENFYDAFETVVYGLQRHGITIATPRQTFHPKDIKQNVFAIIVALQTAHAESEKKSERLGAAWAEKKALARQNLVPATKRLPQWLEIKDGKIVVIEAAAKCIREIFDSVPEIGRMRLVKKLNLGNGWKPQGSRNWGKNCGWRISYIGKILKNRAVFGEYQPYTKRGGGSRVPDGPPISGYFPEVITEAQFNAVQRYFLENKEKTKGGKTGLALNIFVHLAKCGYCGGSMTFRDRGPLPKGGQYLTCERADRGVLPCKAHNFKYPEILDAVFWGIPDLDGERILPAESDNKKKCDTMRQRIAEMKGEVFGINEKIGKVMAALENSEPGTEARYTARINELTRDEDNLNNEIAKLQSELNKVQRGPKAFKKWQDGLVELRKLIGDKEAVDLRLRARALLRESIQRIEVFGHGYEKAYDPSKNEDELPLRGPARTDAIEAYVDDVVEDSGMAIAPQKLRAFKRWLLGKRMSRNGRFIRVHFFPQGSVDLVPPGSLADGIRLSGNVQLPPTKRQKVKLDRRPDIGQLWKEFQKT